MTCAPGLVEWIAWVMGTLSGSIARKEVEEKSWQVKRTVE